MDNIVSFNRADSAYASQVIGKLLPDSDARRCVLKLIAECIRANSVKSQTWGITLQDNEVALNIGGRFYAVHIKSGKVAIFFVPETGTPTLEITNPFRTYPDVQKAWVSQDQIVEWLPRLETGVVNFVQMAVTRFNRSSVGIPRAHSPGVLRYIEQELNITLPDPVYSQEVSSTNQSPRYWAGGHNWSTGSMLQEFLDASAWWHGFVPEDTRSSAIETRRRFEQITMGDYFAIKGYGGQNSLNIYYVGRVTGKDDEGQRVLLDPLPIPQPDTIHPAKGSGSWFGTLREVTNSEIISWMFHEQSYHPNAAKPAEANAPLLFPSNTILYGPPGTGKTYKTIFRAVEMLDGVTPANIDEAKARWDELRNEGRIEFVTFHQSYGYEDFIEGIRPVMDDSNEVPRYEILDGVLKRMALNAQYAMLEQQPLSNPSSLFPSLIRVWDAFLTEVKADQAKTYPGATPRTEFRFEVTKHGSLRMYNILNPSTDAQTLMRETLNEAWDALSQGAEKRAYTLIKTGNYPARKIIFDHLKQLAEQMHGVTANSPDVAADIPLPLDAAYDYLNHGTASGYRLKSDAPNFVLVIDEINRGNISKIFGELITLIEDDKRIGGGLDLTVTLPHSREKFGLPSNLYLLGTMNTADKSIALVDVALRRRFEFEELMPDFETCTGLDDDMRTVLGTLNRRIVLRKDRDHQIGHAFFYKVTNTDEFNRVFEKKIIPLLQEYFYGDWDALRFVLGEEDSAPKFIVEIEEARNLRGARNRWQWYRDAGNYLDILATLKSNYRIAPTGSSLDV